MWVELLAMRHLESWTRSNYGDLGSTPTLDHVIYAPESAGRLKNLTRDRFLANADDYLVHIVTNRVVILSSAVESYFLDFLELYMKNRSKYWSSGNYTPAGNKLYGDVRKVRGLRERVESFAALAPAKINSINQHLDALSDVYTLRNVLAHSAGTCDAFAASRLKIVRFSAGERIALSPGDLIVKLAEPCLLIADALDGKI